MINFFKKLKKLPNKKSGFSLVEVMVACLIISLTTIALMSAASNGIKLSDVALRQVQASSLMEEGVEAVKSIRDTSWDTISTLSLDTTYYLSFDINTNTWSLGTDPTALIDDMFTRTVILSAVSRDENDDIALSGILDEGIKKINVSVSWPYTGETNSKNISFYLADIFN